MLQSIIMFTQNRHPLENYHSHINFQAKMCLSFVKVYRIDLMSRWFSVLVFWLIAKMENNRDGILSAVSSTQQKMDNSLSLNAAETLWVLLVNNIDTFVFLSVSYKYKIWNISNGLGHFTHVFISIYLNLPPSLLTYQ